MIYVFDDDKNKHEGLSKEQIYAVLEQVIEDGDLEHVEPDSAFVSKFKNRVDGGTYGFAFCTQAQYNAMEQAGTLEQNVLYFITDDEEYEALSEAIEDLKTRVESAEDSIVDFAGRLADAEEDVANIKNGTTTVPNATNAAKTDFTNGQWNTLSQGANNQFTTPEDGDYQVIFDGSFTAMAISAKLDFGICHLSRTEEIQKGIDFMLGASGTVAKTVAVLCCTTSGKIEIYYWSETSTINKASGTLSIKKIN